MNQRLFPILICALGLGVSSLWFSNTVYGDSTNQVAAAAPAPAPTVAGTAVPDTFRSYLQLQEQLHETQLAIERAEQAMELATLRSTAMLSNRLQSIEQTVELQRAHELDIVRDMMFITGAFVLIGVLALLLTSYFHWRAVSRLGEIAAALPVSRGLGTLPAGAALGLGESPALEQTNQRLLGALERLEKRILELESHDSARQLTNGAKTAQPLEIQPEKKAEVPEMSVEPAQTNTATNTEDSARHSEQITLLTTKGQTLLAQDQAELALACFDEVLVLDPRNPDLLVKKGDALEKLRRTKEALECYDRALAIDDSMTIAYLHKGGLLNRVERFDEAMHCYEQALRTQDKARAA